MATVRPMRIGRYVLFDELASGGMASVHFGRLLGPGGFSKTVAIKRLHRAFARDPAFRESILDEGRLAARIRHPNVVPPLDVLSESGELLLVMEYVHGESLSKLARAARGRSQAVPISVSATILSNVLFGLHAAHEAKDEKGRPLDIVHRDVSPQNVLVGVDGVARVIDFGIAKAVTTTESTSTGVIKGKIPYLAPEQLEGEPATRRTDVYAASVVLWEALAGKRLFEGEDDQEILRKILAMAVPPPSVFNPAVPPEVDAVVMRGIARSPSERFETAREMALALEDSARLATASVVGAWCERLAADALAERAELLAEVEANDGSALSSPPPSQARPAGASFAPSISMSTTFGARTVHGPVAELSEAPGAELGPIAPRPALPRSTSPAVFATTQPALDDRPRPPPKGALAQPAIEIPNVAWLPDKPAPKPEGTGRRIVKVAAVLILLATLLVVVLLPSILKRLVVSGAADRGVTLTLERIEISRRSLKLVDVRATIVDLPAVTAHAGSVEVGLARLSPARVAISDLDLEVEGERADVARRLARYRGAHEARLLDWAGGVRALSVAGKIDWRGITGPSSDALFENVAIEATGPDARSLDAQVHFAAPLLTLKSGDLRAGPFRFESDRRDGITTSVLHLDPSGTYPARVSWTANDDGPTSVKFAIPPLSLADLRIPPAIFGGAAGGSTRLEVRGEATFPPRADARPIEAIVSPLSVFPGADPIAVAFELPLGGGAKPARLDHASVVASRVDAVGAAGTAFATAPLAGTLDLDAVVVLDLEGKSTPIPCAGRGETQLDVRVAVSPFDIARTLVAFAPEPACTPRLR